MTDRFKQRLVGVLVLVALAVIFIPALFNFEPSPPLDETSQIPPAPDIDPVEIEEPVKPAVADGTIDQDAAFEVPPVESGQVESQGPEPESLDEQVLAAPSGADATPNTNMPAQKPALKESGLPAAWVIQVASYSEASSADSLVEQLQKAGFKAYSEPAMSGERRVYRVFEGPYVLKERADAQKTRVDSAIGVKSLVLPFEP